MLKSLVLASTIVGSVIPAAAPVATNSQPTPDPGVAASAKVNISYENKDGIKTVAHNFGLASTTSLLVDLFYVDDIFTGTNPNYVNANFSADLLSEAVSVKETNGKNIARVYPETKDEIIKSRLTDFSSINALPMNEWGSPDKYLFNGVLDPIENKYTSSYSPYSPGSWHNGGKMSNEISGVFLKSSSDFFEIDILDKFWKINSTGYPVGGVNYETVFYFNPESGKVKGSPTGIETDNLDLTTIYRPQ